MRVVNKMFREMCETPELLQTIYTLKIFLKIACTVVPIIIIYGMMKDLFKSVVSDQKITMSFQQCVKRIIAGLIVFFIPTIVNYAINLTNDSDALYRMELCNNNATPDNIKYFRSIADVERIITTLEANTSKENLKRAEKAYESIVSFAREDTLVDFRMRISKAEIEVNKQEDIQKGIKPALIGEDEVYKFITCPDCENEIILNPIKFIIDKMLIFSPIIIGNISSLVDKKTAISVPIVITLLENKLDAIALKPH